MHTCMAKASSQRYQIMAMMLKEVNAPRAPPALQWSRRDRCSVDVRSSKIIFGGFIPVTSQPGMWVTQQPTCQPLLPTWHKDQL